MRGRLPPKAGSRHVKPCECTTCERARGEAVRDAMLRCTSEMGRIVQGLVVHYNRCVDELEAKIRELEGLPR